MLSHLEIFAFLPSCPSQSPALNKDGERSHRADYVPPVSTPRAGLGQECICLLQVPQPATGVGFELIGDWNFKLD